MEGWVKLHKRLRDHDLLKDDSAYKLFTVLLMYVNTQTGKYTAGRYQLGEMAGMKPETARKALQRLEKKWQICTTSSTNRFTEITILNWGKYQAKPSDDTSTDTNKVPTKYQQSTTNKEIRYKKQEEEDMSDKSDVQAERFEDFDYFWEAYPKKELKRKAKEIWTRKKLSAQLEAILSFVEQAKQTDRWIKGYIKQPTAFLNGECWNDDLSSYNDKRAKQGIAIIS